MVSKEEQLYLSNQLCFPLYAASRLTTRLYGPYLKELDISYPQYLVLLVLWEQDGLAVKEIVQKLHLETNTLTPLLKRLEQKSLVKRSRSSQDERSVSIHLSESGKKLREKALDIPEKIVAAFAGSELNAAEVEGFRQGLLKVLEALKTQLAH